MKKTLLLLAVTMMASVGFSQVIFYVEAPSPNEGNYDFSYAQASSGWGVVDLTDPANSVTDTLVLVDDGTVGDSLGCSPLINGVDVNDKIAVLYRGDCQFGLKAFNCQNAGARAVVIINNVAGAPISMGGGTDGPNVTIPVVMITDVDGALLRAEIDAGNTTAFIGNKANFYGNDLGFYPNNVMRSRQFGNVQDLSQDASEFDVEVGAWVFNYGSLDQTGITLTANITRDGNNIYSQTSAPVDIVSGDSAYVSLTTYSETSYTNGYYSLTYDVSSGANEEFAQDNMVVTHFTVSDGGYSYGALDSTTMMPVSTGGSRLGGNPAPTSFTACITFSDPNASRMGAEGITFTAVTNADDSLTDKYIEVKAYEWNDVWTDVNDAAFTDLVEVASGEYTYTSDLQDEAVYAPFVTPFAFTDDQWYLFCVTSYDEPVFIGYDNDIDYELNSKTYKMPMFPVGETMPTQAAFGGGTGEGSFTTQAPAIMVNMIPSLGIGIEENEEVEITAYPNPAKEMLNIPVEGLGNGELKIFDLAGKMVYSQNVNANNGNMISIDMDNLTNGSYIFSIDFESGKKSTFNVVVSK